MRNLVLEDDPILKKRGKSFDFDNPQEDPKKLKEELFFENSDIIKCFTFNDFKEKVIKKGKLLTVKNVNTCRINLPKKIKPIHKEDNYDPFKRMKTLAGLNKPK